MLFLLRGLSFLGLPTNAAGLNPDFARIVKVAEQQMKKWIFGVMNQAEIRSCLDSKVLRRGWQGSGYLISLRMRRSASEK